VPLERMSAAGRSRPRLSRNSARWKPPDIHLCSGSDMERR
jgi:hypothetical protein